MDSIEVQQTPSDTPQSSRLFIIVVITINNSNTVILNTILQNPSTDGEARGVTEHYLILSVSEEHQFFPFTFTFSLTPVRSLHFFTSVLSSTGLDFVVGTVPSRSRHPISLGHLHRRRRRYLTTYVP